MVNCTVCKNNSKGKTLAFFSYPINITRRNSWLKAVGREDLIDKLKDVRRPAPKICEEHFEPHFFRLYANGAKYLKCNAFPTLRLPDKVSSCSNNLLVTGWRVDPGNLIVLNDNITNDIDTQSVRDAKVITSNSGSTIRGRKRTLSDDAAIEQTQTESDSLMPKGMLQLLQWQRELNGDKSENHSGESFLCFALHLHYLGSTAYQFLKNTFHLPPLNTLKKLVKPRGSKIDDKLFSVLKIKVDKMGLQEKICSVCVSCVPVKTNLFYDTTHDRIVGFSDINGRQKYEPAQYAVVIIVRGVVLNWKQLISYAFLSHFKNDTAINDWIKQIITNLLKIGLDVRTLVSDHSDYLDLSKDVNIDNTCFFIHGHKIYYIFDVPRLMNSLKNNLMTCNFIYGSKVGKWYHIKDMYNQDKISLVRLAPKLTENHIQASKSVKLTAQVLSTTVAFAIKTLMQSNLTDSSAKNTIELVLKLDKLFDILNSCKLRDHNKFKTAFCGEDFQIDFLQEMLGFFRRLKLVEAGSNKDVTSSMKFIKCFQITIKSFLHLFNDLQLKGIQSIYTRRLNLEEVDNFFEKVNQTNEVDSQPTCRQVVQTFNRIFVVDILKEPVKKALGNDFESLLALNVDSTALIEAFSLNCKDVTPMLLDSNDYQFELPKENGLLMLSVYLYKKCLEHHMCETLISYVNTCSQELAESELEEIHRALPNSFLTFIELLDVNFCDYFTNMSISNIDKDANICNDVLLQIQFFTFGAPCECFPIEYLKKFFVRSRIYHTVKRYNAFLKSEKYGETPFDVRFL